jgi:hypothetical protein
MMPRVPESGFWEEVPSISRNNPVIRSVVVYMILYL